VFDDGRNLLRIDDRQVEEFLDFDADPMPAFVGFGRLAGHDGPFMGLSTRRFASMICDPFTGNSRVRWSCNLEHCVEDEETHPPNAWLSAPVSNYAKTWCCEARRLRR
jgi:hypothetical protein